jgi:NAD(P)-dependent dehydrogenase (short-subunit alcohol dehydrogenase family)
MNKVAIVTGGSSGIGASAVNALIRDGYKVYELSRREKGLEGSEAIHISTDVTDEAQTAKAVKYVAETEGKIDVLVNCAGFGISGAIEFTKLSDAKRQLDVNLLGTFIMNKAVIPYMRKAGGGRIINVSSVAACVSIPFQAWYSISKAGINTLTMALINEVRPFNISVCAIMPGDTKTGFTDARIKEGAGSEVYGGIISRSITQMERDERNGGSPDKIGRFICSLAAKKHVRPLYTPGLQYKLFILLGKILPSRLSNYIVGLVYAR